MDVTYRSLPHLYSLFSLPYQIFTVILPLSNIKGWSGIVFRCILVPQAYPNPPPKIIKNLVGPDEQA
jgi:hypothetical protein